MTTEIDRRGFSLYSMNCNAALDSGVYQMPENHGQ